MTGERSAPASGLDVSYGAVTVLGSPEGGRYPGGNSLLIRGTRGTVLVDPSLEVHRRGGVPGAVDLVAISHAHEDHLAALHLFPDRPVLAHPAEVGAVRSPDVLLAGFGAGSREAEVLHTSFGPYYGDLSSSLEDFEASLSRLREVEARWYGTAHHVGVLEGRSAFLAALDRCAAVIRRRDDVLLALLRRPRTLDDVVAHRLVHRPHVQLPLVDAVERRTARLHLERLGRRGAVVATDDGYVVV
jgi:hypothetical protein